MKQVLLLFLLLSFLCSSGQVLRKRTAKLMGSRFDITIVATDSLSAEKSIDEVVAEVSRIEDLISDWKEDSQVSMVNRNAGIAPVKVDAEVFSLTKRALKLSKVTKGAFDISFAAMDRIWKFDGSMTEMPSPEAVKKSVNLVGYKDIILNEDSLTIFLKRKGMKIGFGALGEGYATDRCRDLMLAKGIASGIVNGSGDMSTWGQQPDGSSWKVGITNPIYKDTIFAIVPLVQSAVVTSGSYEKFVVFEGQRYAHIIDPVSGYPAKGLASVTVFGPDAELANGLSTSIMVMGLKKGLRLINKYRKYSCITVSDKGQVIASKKINLKDFILSDPI